MLRPEFLKMRAPPLEYEKLSDRQKRLIEEIGGPRQGQVGGPFLPWLLGKPELADAINQVGRVLRFEGLLDKRLLEVAVLCVARHWRSDFQWGAHVPLAAKFGLAAEVIDAIAARRTPISRARDEVLVHDCVEVLLELRRIPDDLYSAALAKFGFDQMVELVTAVGQYTLAALVTNAFEIGATDGTLYFGRPQLR